MVLLPGLLLNNNYQKDINMKFKNIFIGALLLTSGFLTSCEKEEPEIEMTSIGIAAGTWYVTYKQLGTNGSLTDVGGGYNELATYNTAANDGAQIWVDDLEHFWEFKVKANFDGNAMAFSGTDLANNYYTSKVNITEGKIVEGGGLSITKVPVDSIYMRVTFSDDTPANGKTYIVSGHRRTGFIEDEP